MKTIVIFKKVLLIVLAVILLQAINIEDSQAAPPASGGSYHRVRYGETLSSIGWRYGVNAHSIARANGLANPNYIYAGQTLYIPSGHGYNNYTNYNNRYYNNTYYGNRYNNYTNYNNRHYYPNDNCRYHNNSHHGHRNYNQRYAYGY